MIQQDNLEVLVAELKSFNEKVLNDFFQDLLDSGVTKKTAKKHLMNIKFFTESLYYYLPESSKDLQPITNIDCTHVMGFMSDFFPRKAMWSSTSNAKENVTSFNKLFLWLLETKYITENNFNNFKEIVKDEKQYWYSLYSDDDNYSTSVY